MYKILLLEDDLILGDTISDILENAGFEATWVKDSQVALHHTFSNNYNLFLFDVNVPFINGFELLKELRESGDITPAIFITAKVDIDSISKGFDVGADDYIKKPFELEELIIRINAQIKKSFKSYSNNILYKDLSFDIEKEKIYKDKVELHLTPSEYKLFELFMKNIGRTILKEEILYHIHNGDEGSEATLRVQISKLKKVGLEISNSRGVGYRCEQI
ncbi:MAG: DNA-binding response OmpR family regulator [Sulfurimonas sp.]